MTKWTKVSPPNSANFSTIQITESLRLLPVAVGLLLTVKHIKNSLHFAMIFTQSMVMSLTFVVDTLNKLKSHFICILRA